MFIFSFVNDLSLDHENQYCRPKNVRVGCFSPMIVKSSPALQLNTVH